jgi:hypothetical protein
MKLSANQFGIIMIFVGGLMPIPVFSHSLNPTEMTKHPQHSILVSNLPYGSPAQIANNPRAYCNR